MTQLEYLVALISIIVGLGLADLARSLRDLVRPDRAVRWHWLPLVWAGIVFLIVLQLWWTSFRLLQAEVFGQVLVFLPYLLSFLVLYLACAFALPDSDWEANGPSGDGGAEAEEGRLDLEAFYFSRAHRRWFFGSMIVLLVLGQVMGTALAVTWDRVEINLWARVQTVGFNLVIAALFGGLIAIRRWWVHVGATLFVLAAVLYSLATGIPPLG